MKFKKYLCLAIILILFLSVCIPAYAEESTPCISVTVDSSTTDYNSFESGWNKAVSYNSKAVTVKLNKNWKAGNDGSFGSGAGFTDGAILCSKPNMVLDLNGFSIDRNIYAPRKDGAVIYVKTNFTIIDSKSNEYTVSKLVKGGVITGGNNENRGGGIVLKESGTLNFNGGTILNCISTDDGGGISLEGSGTTLNVNGGNFYGNRTYDGNLDNSGGAVYCDEGKVNIANSILEGNYAEDKGGAIYVSNGSLNANNCVFISNYAKEEGGAVYLCDDSTSEFEDCSFSKNTSENDGGAVFFDSSKGSYLYNCNMYHNHSGSEGGAIHVNAKKIFVIGGNYQYNSAVEHGGGIYVDSMYDCNISGKLIVKDNTVGGNQNDLCLQNGNFSTAYLYSGGLYEGSSVWICSTDNSPRLAISDIDKYQYLNYIHLDKGYKLSEIQTHDLSKDNIRAEGSIIGNGNIVVIVILGAVIIAAGIIAVIFYTRRKKKGAEKNEA